MRPPYIEATYVEGNFPVYFEGLLRPLFSSLVSSSFIKCSRGSDEVTVTAGIGHIKGTLACSQGSDDYGRQASAASHAYMHTHIT